MKHSRVYKYLEDIFTTTSSLITTNMKCVSCRVRNLLKVFLLLFSFSDSAEVHRAAVFGGGPGHLSGLCCCHCVRPISKWTISDLMENLNGPRPWPQRVCQKWERVKSVHRRHLNHAPLLLMPTWGSIACPKSPDRY